MDVVFFRRSLDDTQLDSGTFRVSMLLDLCGFEFSGRLICPREKLSTAEEVGSAWNQRRDSHPDLDQHPTRWSELIALPRCKC